MKRTLLILLAVAILALMLPAAAFCTEEYAQKTGRACSACHVSSSGGGELTPAGKEYAATLSDWRQSPPSSLRLLRFGAGYLHILTAFLWFGTILYVHLVLKPAYAANGLPRGEMLVGLVSMLVMGLTGAFLTVFRFSSLADLFQSRFGILLSVKIGLFLIMVISALFVVLVIGPRLRQKKKGGKGSIKPEMTTADLDDCNGKEGMPACFGYNGRVYDVTASRLWKDGDHMRRHAAGTNLTEALKLAPHGEDKVLAMPVVATLVPGETKQGRPLHEMVFYFMAYMNLTIVFCIILILAAWRWSW
ncbi:CopD family protein [Geotalea sp. SG265]|uniref:CopD family protein n=1 Tax=Geotalea sp. SG265 TaxID=2922867 RepID=UPI001FAF4055|nr:CopD family protein [Geotalea sp. SG265]